MVFLAIICIVLAIFNIFFSLYLYIKNKEKISNIEVNIAFISDSIQKLYSDLQNSNIDFDKTIKNNIKYLEQNIFSLRYEFTIKLIDDIRNNIKSLVSTELEKQKFK